MTDMIRSFNRDFDAITLLHGERTAFVPVAVEKNAVTYAQLNELMDRNLQWLSDLGVPKGGRVGVLMPNSIEMMVLFLACIRGGYGFAPLACDTVRPEVSSWARLIRPSVCVHGSLLLEDVLQGLDDAGIRKVPVNTDGSFAHLPTERGGHRGSDARVFIHTSGSTGVPKAIVLDSDKLWSAGYAFMRVHGQEFNRRFCIWNYLPQSYLGGLFNMGLIPMSVAGTSIIDDTFSGKTFLSFWQTVDRFDINALWLVPAIVRGLIAMGKRSHRTDLKKYGKKIDVAFLGTAPIELETKREFESMFGIPLLENFALSETTFLTTELLGEDSMREEGSVGRPLPYVKLRLDPIKGNDDSQYREICVDTPFLAEGYLYTDGEISRKIRDGFFPTGDVGNLKIDGRLVLMGRTRDIIKKGGHMVALREIELLALTHPAVTDAAAVPVGHPFYGESYELWVQLRVGETRDVLAEVRSFIFDSLAKHKWPEDVKAISELPKTASGKVKKFTLKKDWA